MANYTDVSLEYIRNLLLELNASAIVDATRTHSTEAFTALTDVLKSHSEDINENSVKDLFTTALQFCEDNPVQAASILLMFISFAAPGALWFPFARLLGFTRLGPVANSAASFFQARFGTVWAFRIFQSAKMGGYGVRTMNLVTQASAALAGGAAFLWNRTAEWLPGGKL